MLSGVTGKRENRMKFQADAVLKCFSLVCKMSPIRPYKVMDDGEWIMYNYQSSISNYQLRASDLSGGYCSGVPPLPIPNREVKPACADGTAMQCGRVGGRHFFMRSPDSAMSQGFFRVFLGSFKRNH